MPSSANITFFSGAVNAATLMLVQNTASTPVMMRASNALPEVYLCRDIIDFRKGINGLAVLVEDSLRLNPFSETLFMFCNRPRNWVKILYWEHSGFCLWQSRLEKSRFHWPRQRQGDIVILTGRQLRWLLDGYDISRMKAHEKLYFCSVL